MVLSDSSIVYYNGAKKLVEPLVPENVSGASIDLTLDNEYFDLYAEMKVPMDSGIRLAPNEFLLMSTAEKVNVPEDMVAIVKGKSSWARVGVMVECAGLIDPGFSGNITLEVKNLRDKTRSIPLKPGDKIAQVFFMKLDKAAEKPYSKKYGHHYQGQVGVTKSVLYNPVRFV